MFPFIHAYRGIYGTYMVYLQPSSNRKVSEQPTYSPAKRSKKNSRIENHQYPVIPSCADDVRTMMMLTPPPPTDKVVLTALRCLALLMVLMKINGDIPFL